MQESLLLHLLLLLIHLLRRAGEASSASLALPGCPDKCGNVTIAYPFGVRDGCYRQDESNLSFLISCNASFSPPKSFIKTSSIEVLNASFEKVLVSNTVAKVCYNTSGQNIVYEDDTWIRLGNSPFIFSDVQNRFTVLGCNAQADIKNYDFASRCKSYCSDEESMVNALCNRSGCCQATIPKGIKYYNITAPTMYYSDEHDWSFAPCNYAFLADKDNFNFSVTDFLDPHFIDKAERVPVVLDWAVGTETCEEAKMKANFACGGNSTCTDSTNGPGYRCSCLRGYDGNPYLPQGCQDINECADQAQKTCRGGSICINTLGNYTCHCTHGKYEDGNCIGENSFPLMKVALGVGGSGLILIVISGSCLCWMLMQRSRMKLRGKFFKQNGGLQLQQHISQQQGAADTSEIFAAKELEKATNNYDKSRIIGEGGSGTVYKGNLSNNRVVAIKKSKTVDKSQIEQFINEVFILSQINHRNVVKLLGCCLETEVPLLVYEYVTHGTLFHHIHDNSSVSFLSWNHRLRIASETAAALAYLHSAASIPIIHRDVKSANILLDDNYRAKVSDFGASRLIPMDKSHLTTLVQGTSGYLDPEYLHSSQLTEKSDVYSFGVVLAELLTGKKPVSFERSEEERNLSRYFILSMEQNRLLEIVDAQVVDQARIEKLSAVAELAKRCLSEKGVERPTMKEVAAELEGLRRL